MKRPDSRARLRQPWRDSAVPQECNPTHVRPLQASDMSPPAAIKLRAIEGTARRPLHASARLLTFDIGTQSHNLRNCDQPVLPAQLVTPAHRRAQLRPIISMRTFVSATFSRRRQWCVSGTTWTPASSGPTGDTACMISTSRRDSADLPPVEGWSDMVRPDPVADSVVIATLACYKSATMQMEGQSWPVSPCAT